MGVTIPALIYIPALPACLPAYPLPAACSVLPRLAGGRGGIQRVVAVDSSGAQLERLRVRGTE